MADTTQCRYCNGSCVKQNAVICKVCNQFYHPSCANRCKSSREGVYRCCSARGASDMEIDEGDIGRTTTSSTGPSPPPSYDSVNVSTTLENNAPAQNIPIMATSSINLSLPVLSFIGDVGSQNDAVTNSLRSFAGEISNAFNRFNASINEQFNSINSQYENFKTEFTNNTATTNDKLDMINNNVTDLKLVTNNNATRINHIENQFTAIGARSLELENSFTNTNLRMRQFSDNLGNLTERVSAIPPAVNFDHIIAEIQERYNRQFNLFVYNVAEQENEDITTLQNTIVEILHTIGFNNNFSQVKRIGRPNQVNQRGPRAVVVTLNNRGDVIFILKNKYKLVSNVRISEDLTQQQRELLNNLRAEVNYKNANRTDNSIMWTIKYIKGVPTIVEQEQQQNQRNRNTQPGILRSNIRNNNNNNNNNAQGN